MMFVVQQYFFIILSIWSLKLVKNSSPRIKHKHIHTCKLSLVCAFSIEVRDSRAAKDWGHEQATLPPFISNRANTHHHTPHPLSLYIYIYNHHQSSLLHSYALSPFLLCQHSPRVYFFFCNCSFCNSLQHPFAMSSSQSKKLINNPNDVATEYIEGMVETYPNLQYLDGFPEVKVLLRADVSRGTYSKVAIISGGGSGHEPATGGFVGEGMLTAAVCGDVFASPPMNSILAAIRAVTGPPGCLLIVTNYTGDRLNFGLAAEQAKSEGYKVEMVIVGDDCALPPTGIIGRRGLAGTILVQKVAGAAAEAGLPLASVAAEAVEAASVIGTMGVALSVCTIPGQVTSDRLGPGKMELGLGIHGEPGVAVVDLKPVDEIVSLILKQIISSETGCVTIKPGCKVALMVNGLGATPLMELMVATGKAVAQLQLDHGLAVERVYTGSFMTSLDMAGFSLTVMKVEASLLQRLDHPTKAPYWVVGVSGPRPPTKLPIPVPAPPTKTKKAHCRPQELNIEGQIMEMAIKAAAEALINIKESLNEWDSKVGDGDCGSTISRGAHAILEDMEKYYPLNDPAATIGEIGASIGRVMGGTSGVIYDIFFKAAYAKLKENSAKITAKEWANALEAAVEAVSKYGGATAGCRTLLDALIPASKALQERLSAGDSPLTAFMISSEAALEGAESTKKMRPQAGRSAYIPTENLGTVPDPGAAAVAAWYKAAAKAVTEFSQKET